MFDLSYMVPATLFLNRGKNVVIMSMFFDRNLYKNIVATDDNYSV